MLSNVTEFSEPIVPFPHHRGGVRSSGCFFERGSERETSNHVVRHLVWTELRLIKRCVGWDPEDLYAFVCLISFACIKDPQCLRGDSAVGVVSHGRLRVADDVRGIGVSYRQRDSHFLRRFYVSCGD